MLSSSFEPMQDYVRSTKILPGMPKRMPMPWTTRQLFKTVIFQILPDPTRCVLSKPIPIHVTTAHINPNIRNTMPHVKLNRICTKSYLGHCAVRHGFPLGLPWLNFGFLLMPSGARLGPNSRANVGHAVGTRIMFFFVVLGAL